MQKFIKTLHLKARKNNRRIVLSEGTDERVLKATEIILKEKIAKITLIGPSQKIKARINKMKLKIDWENLEIQDPQTSKFTQEFEEKLYALRKKKGLTKNKAKALIKDPTYFGTMMVKEGYSDGMVTGANHETADAIRPALQIIKTKERFHKVSGVFLMVLENRIIFFADAAITIDPTPKDIAITAIDTAETAVKFGIKPKIALLSFSTKTQGNFTQTKKIQKALNMIKCRRPDLIVDGEMQVDAALVPNVAIKKCPMSPIKGDANILIFPNLEAANIAYKLVERLAKAKAIGPILQGLKNPVNDLSRGCDYKDIVNVIAFTACE